MLFESNIKSLKKVYQGKVRDIYEVDDRHWLLLPVIVSLPLTSSYLILSLKKAWC